MSIRDRGALDQEGIDVVNSQPADRTMWNSLLHSGLAGSFMSFPHVAPNADALREAGAKAAIYRGMIEYSIMLAGENEGVRGGVASLTAAVRRVAPGIEAA